MTLLRRYTIACISLVPVISSSQNVAKPNFFILGAPKCGTTSLAHWLAQHPNVYMAPVKEPHYYSTDFSISVPLTPSMYSNLFDGVNRSHQAIGEASVWYLCSKVAVSRILGEIHNARYIVMLRNPVEMAPSLHWQAVFTGDEDILDFRTAWDLQGPRSRGLHVPKTCRDPKLIQYKAACSTGAQLQRLYDTVCSGRVHTVFLEDLENDLETTWEGVLRFLEIPPANNIVFKKQNPAKHWRFAWVRRLGRRYLELQQSLNVPPLGLGVFEKLRKYSIRETSRPAVSSSTVELLEAEFRGDIQLLSKLTGRNLDRWVH